MQVHSRETVESADLMIEMLTTWEEKRREGILLTAEDLCHDDPVTQQKLSRRISRRLKMLQTMETNLKPELGQHVFHQKPPEVPGYELLDVLGSGGMGIVYKAHQKGLSRTVALKMVHFGVGTSSSDLARFRFEAETVAKLQHANIVQIYEVDQFEGHPFVVLEFVDGGNLSQSLRGIPLSAAKSASLLQTLAETVHYAHQQGVIHRDLKPANILLTSDGIPKITDFGLAKRLDENDDKTRTGAVIGTPNYMSPEQASGRVKESGISTDIYSLGVILYEMLTGRVPFVGETVLETLEQVRNFDAVPPRQLVPKVPRDLETICLKCLEKDPHRRYLTAQLLANDLQSFQKGEAVQARPDSFVSVLGRMIGRVHAHTEHFKQWSMLCLFLAPVAPIVLTILVLGFRNRPNYPQLAILVSLLTIVVVRMTLQLGIRDGLQLMPARLRRHLHIVFNSNSAASATTFFAVWWNCAADRTEQMLLFFPIFTAIMSLVSFALASELGYFLVTGSIALAFAIPMAIFPVWSPLFLGLVLMANIGGIGIYLRWIAYRETRAATSLH